MLPSLQHHASAPPSTKLKISFNLPVRHFFNLALFIYIYNGNFDWSMFNIYDVLLTSPNVRMVKIIPLPIPLPSKKSYFQWAGIPYTFWYY